MPDLRKQRGESTREAILVAAETCFAQHGFAGARIDTIAEMAGFNKALIFRYYGDKLGLYTAVLRRSDEAMTNLFARFFVLLAADTTIASDSARFRSFLQTMFGDVFDFMLEHPNFTRIINWEQAEGWTTFERIVAQFETTDLAHLEPIFATARDAGVIRADMNSVVAVMLAFQLCWSSAMALPIYRSLLSDRDASPATALALMRTQVIALIVAGIMNDAPEGT